MGDDQGAAMTGEGTPERTPAAGGEALSWMLMAAIQQFTAGQLSEAEAACTAILQIDPDHAEALNLAGMLAVRLGRPEEAVSLLTRAVGAKADFALAWFNLAASQQQLGRTADAAAAYRQAAALNPQYLDAWFSLANLLAESRRFAEAVQAYEQARALAPDMAQIHNNLGNALAGLGRAAEAAAAFRRAIALQPDNADAYTNLAHTLQGEGDQAAALAATGEALAIDPAHAAAWFARSEVKTFTPADPEIERLRALIAADDPPRLGAADRINLQFALGKALMDVGDADGAFAHLQAANRLKRSTFAYDVQGDVRAFAAMARVFDRPFLDRHAGAGDPTPAPIFVLGMPRSGTTLVEQILASHPAVFGAGELDALMDAVADQLGHDLPLETLVGRFADLEADDFRTLAQAYLAAAAAVPTGAERFTDKMPANFRLIGLIGLILPNARILHCTRDPVDTCFSCYTKQFSGQQDFAYDLEELGVYYRAYETLMAHWRAVMPSSRLMDVRYEALVDDLEGEARRLVAFCGLPWDAACLDFHATARSVRTASANQVRKPIYRTSLERWRPYERHLAPLVQALGRR